MSDLIGTCDVRFTPVREALLSQLEREEQLGASVAVAIDGVLVVDLWGGWADAARTRLWTRSTITNVWSITKAMVAITVLVLVERDQLDVDRPVASYWPEFAANGKEHVLVRHVLSHASGVSGLEAPATMADLCDHDAAAARMAAQEPWWDPGSASGYHALNQGHLLGEVVRRVTGMPLGVFFQREVAQPLGADFHIGLQQRDFSRVADVVPPPRPAPRGRAKNSADTVAMRTFRGPVADAAFANTPQWRCAEVPAANGHGNAASVARIQSLMTSGGEVGGVRLLSPKTINLAFQEQISGVDLVLGIPLRWGLGFALPDPLTFPYIPSGKVCFWGGWGGSMVVNDADRRMTFAYVMNKMGSGLVGSPQSEALIRAAYSCVGG